MTSEWPERGRIGARSGFFVLAALLLFALGVSIGALWMGWRVQSEAPLTLVPDTRPESATVVLGGIRDGKLVGHLTGDVRLIAGESAVTADTDGNFAIGDSALLTNRITVAAPLWAQFVASRRGSKYYPLASSQGAAIVPENRVYFRSAEEAERAGYRR